MRPGRIGANWGNFRQLLGNRIEFCSPAFLTAPDRDCTPRNSTGRGQGEFSLFDHASEICYKTQAEAGCECDGVRANDRGEFPDEPPSSILGNGNLLTLILAP